MAKSKKLLTSVVALGTAVTLTLGGTFAWQSVNQTVINEASDKNNPGGRLHNDLYYVDSMKTDSNVYVENFDTDDIFARVRLEEYMEVVLNYGTPAQKVVNITGQKLDKTTGEPLENQNVITEKNKYDYEYTIHKFDGDNATDDYFKWNPGTAESEAVYMPTFNKNKDSLRADLHGLYVDRVGGISNRGAEQYTAKPWSVGDEVSGYEIWDADSNSVDELKDLSLETLENLIEVGDQAEVDETVLKAVKFTEATHTAKAVGDTKGLISMTEWMKLVNDNAETYVKDGVLTDAGREAMYGYWVYDADGWVYWSAPIAGGETTGLLLDGFDLIDVMDNTWYYAINVVGQFVTANDVGKANNTGFYATLDTPTTTAEDGEDETTPAKPVSDDAEKLLALIGVQFPVDDVDDDNDNNGGDEVVDTSPVLILKETTLPTVSFAIRDGNGMRVHDQNGQPVSLENLVVKNKGIEYEVSEEMTSGIYCYYPDGKLRTYWDVMSGEGISDGFLVVSYKDTDQFGCIPMNNASNPGGTKVEASTPVNQVTAGYSNGNELGNLTYSENLVIVPVESVDETVSSNAEKALKEGVDYTVEYSDRSYTENNPYMNDYGITKIATVKIDARYAGQMLKTYSVKDDDGRYFCNVIFVDPDITESIVPTPDNEDNTADEVIVTGTADEGLKVTYKRQADAVYTAGIDACEFKLKPEYNNEVLTDTGKVTLTVNVDGTDKATVTGSDFTESTEDGDGWLKCTVPVFAGKTGDVQVKLTLSCTVSEDVIVTTNPYEIKFTQGGSVVG